MTEVAALALPQLFSIVPDATAPRPRQNSRLDLDTSLVSSNGCFEFDRVIKCGYVEKRTKTKQWKPVYLVLRPGYLSMYKNEKETKLRYQIHLPDLNAVTFLKDPKQKRHNVFGLFSSSKNFHLQARSLQDAHEWVDLIRKDARLEEEEEEMLLARPLGRSLSPIAPYALPPNGLTNIDEQINRMPEQFLSSSPETFGPPAPGFLGYGENSVIDSSGGEIASHSDMSDTDFQRIRGSSMESQPFPGHIEVGSIPPGTRLPYRPAAQRSTSQVSVTNKEQELDRVVWQGWLWQLKSKGGVKQWKDMWGVLRRRNLILYKDESEYLAQWIVHLSIVVDVVDIDPLNKSKENCLQVITEEKSFKFCAHDEESLVQFIGALKSLIAKRRALESRLAASYS
ncbi:PH domain containing protein [Cordyceps militaris CM01]|uniref:PH domain containing protein n=2 Tax=Cordyceps militaris TaxID=73501 RepID=G3JNB8_CORMM|nr:PH domain containing protein [Cordyceps militaris CM01]ATY62040.1 PH domain containing [Cordyceps militaris]EGX90300.1 PH domain containing protein [Cordyceps militaris CM01]